MTIRLSGHAKYPEIDATMADAGEYTVRTVYGQGIRLAYANTREEAEQAKRAFEQVLAPRFTRDEAIAIVRHAADGDGRVVRDAFNAGIRLALVALADAGVFGDVPSPEHGPSQTMRDLLDAAGIR
jgi:hypothetical protein